MLNARQGNLGFPDSDEFSSVPPCSFRPQDAYLWFVPAVCALIGVQPCLAASRAPVPPASTPSVPSINSPPEIPSGPYKVAPPYFAADGVTFRPEHGVRTRLAGIETVARNAICSDAASQPFACGLHARVELNNLMRQREFECSPVAPWNGIYVEAECHAGSIDLGREMVAAGLARSIPGGWFDAIEAQAKREGRGLWNGDWTVRQK